MSTEYVEVDFVNDLFPIFPNYSERNNETFKLLDLRRAAER